MVRRVAHGDADPEAPHTASAPPLSGPQGLTEPDLFVESGRQALTLIARWCRSHHIELALLPSYHCDSMALPFWLEGMRVHFVDIGDDLQFRPDALRSAIAELGEQAVVVWTRVGGISPSPQLVTVLEDAYRAGHVLIDDATHAILDDLLATPEHPPLPTVDFRLASMRKLVPLTDGAMIWSRPDIVLDAPQPRGSLDDELAASRSTLLTRAAALNYRTPLPAPSMLTTETGAGHEPPATPAAVRDYLGQLGESEELFDRALTPVEVSRGARSQLSSFDLVRQARRECQALRAFVRALEGSPKTGGAPPPAGHDEQTQSPLTVLNAGRACFPIIRTPAAGAIERALAAHGIFSPQSWPRPDYLPASFAWPTDVLSIDCGRSRTSDQIRQIAQIVIDADRA